MLSKRPAALRKQHAKPATNQQPPTDAVEKFLARRPWKWAVQTLTGQELNRALLRIRVHFAPDPMPQWRARRPKHQRAHSTTGEIPVSDYKALFKRLASPDKLTDDEIKRLTLKLSRVVKLPDPAVYEALRKRAAEGLEEKLALLEAKPSTNAASIHAIPNPEPQNNDQQMLDYSKSFVQDGVRYFPLSVAAPVVQAPAPTILHWIKNETKFGGEPLQSYFFAPSNQYFIGEDSIERAANRFIKWRKGKPAGPAGPVTLGHTKDKSGFIGLSEAERILGVSKRTMYLWATLGKAPTDKQPEVIQCPSSEHFYIREKDVYALKKLIPRSGLPLGRRTQLVTPHA